MAGLVAWYTYKITQSFQNCHLVRLALYPELNKMFNLKNDDNVMNLNNFLPQDTFDSIFIHFEKSKIDKCCTLFRHSNHSFGKKDVFHKPFLPDLVKRCSVCRMP